MPPVSVVIEGGDAAYSELESSPWDLFLRALGAMGPVKGNLMQDPSQAVLVSIGTAQLARAMCDQIPSGFGRKHLVIREPETVRPDLYRSSTLALFDHIWIPSERWGNEIGAHPFKCPQYIPAILPEHSMSEWASRRNNPCLLLANKFSAVPSEMYSLRRKLLKRASKRGVPIEVIGPGWDASRIRQHVNMQRAVLQCFRAGRIPRLSLMDMFQLGPVPSGITVVGSVEDKGATLSEYKVTFITENSQGYVSEKLIDALVAGCIPVYCGDAEELREFPDDIAMFTKPKADSLLDAWEVVNQMSNAEITHMRSKGQELLRDPKFIGTWKSENSLFNLGKDIVDKCHISST
jgi:hypothetical protein